MAEYKKKSEVLFTFTKMCINDIEGNGGWRRLPDPGKRGLKLSFKGFLATVCKLVYKI